MKISKKNKRWFSFWTREQTTLLKRVKEEKKTDKNWTRVLSKGPKHPFWMPNWYTAVKIISFVVISFFFVHFSYLSRLFEWDFFCLLYSFSDSAFYHKILDSITSIPVIDEESNQYQNFIVIHAGLSAIILPLAIFVAESLRDGEDRFRGKVLVMESKLYPLIFTTMLIFPVFLWGDIDLFWGVLLLCLVATWASISIANIMVVLAKDGEMERRKTKMLQDVLSKDFISNLDAEITKRLADNLIVQFMENDPRIKFKPFRLSVERGFTPIEILKNGYVKDVDFKRFDYLLNEVQKSVTIKKLRAGESENLVAEDSKAETHFVEFSVFYGQEINNENNEIFWIRTDIIENNDNLLDKITRLAQRVITVDGRQLFNKKDNEISKIKARCLDAIKLQDVNELEQVLDQYLHVISEFYSYFELYGGGFSREQAETERGTLFGGFQTIQSLSRDFGKVFEKAMMSGDLEIIRLVGYLPVSIASMSLEKGDHYLFQEFIRFPQYMYSYSFDQTDVRIKDFMRDRTWRYLKEFSDFHLEYKLNKLKHSNKGSNVDEDSVVDYGLYVLKAFQSLMKTAFQKQNLEDFNKFKEATLGLFDRGYGRSNRESGIQKRLKAYRNQMLFGITMWVLHVYSTDSENLTYRSFFNSVAPIFSGKTIKELTQIFLDVHSFEVEKIWNWGNWELEGRPEGGVYGINILEKLEKTYAVLGLKALSGLTDAAIGAVELPHNRDFAFLVEGTRDLIKVLDDIHDNPNNWKFVLNDPAIGKVDSFKALLSSAKKAQDEEDLERVRTSPLEADKLQEFKTSIVDDFNHSASVRKMFEGFGLLKKYKKKYPEEETRFGINTTFEKAAFIKDWHVHYLSSGTGFGASVAYGENRSIINKIKEKATLLSGFDEENMIDKLKSMGKTKNLVLVFTNHSLWDTQIENSENFVSHWQIPDSYKGPRGSDGYYKLDSLCIPVFEVFTQENESFVFLLDKSKLGKFISYNPLKPSESTDQRYDNLFIGIKEFVDGSNPMENYISNPPAWLTEQGDEIKQRNYLKEKVLLNVFERFDFEFDPEFTGYYFEL